MARRSEDDLAAADRRSCRRAARGTYVVDGRGLVIGSTGAKATVAMSGPVALAETEIHWVFCFRGAKVALAAGFERRDEALRTLRERCAP